MSGEELFREVLCGVNCDERKSPKRNSAEGNCPKRNGLGVNYYEELSGEELSYNLSSPSGGAAEDNVVHERILVKGTGQGLLQNGQDTDRQNFYFLYLTENKNLALISFEDL